MVQSGVGACVLPRFLLDNLHLTFIKVVQPRNPTSSQDICLLYRSDRYVGFAMRTFIKNLRAYIETAINHAMSS
ncbi:LysR family transcriptional regulator substrate-binding protein [Paenibacillus sp. 2TAB23]|uniref:LysR family transcriptional regulator substrate-binding protein n=1 Tax=Paenibacillus sp. 2TAB23 TaxID=3233004 RepID=UPI003F9B0492